MQNYLVDSLTLGPRNVTCPFSHTKIRNEAMLVSPAFMLAPIGMDIVSYAT